MNNDTQTLSAPRAPTSTPAAAPDEKRLLKLTIRLLFIVGIIIAILVVAGVWSRASTEKKLKKSALSNTSSRVAVVHPKVATQAAELVLPASVQAYIEAPIYARTQGYLKKWYFDIGSKVKRGELLAEIETPEGDQQLEQARADLQVAKANAQLATSTAERWQSLLKKNAVSKQETDQAVGELSARQAAVEAAQANVRRLEQVQNYEMVYAPFDGVITARQTDIGALIGTGSAKELFHLAAIDRIRVFTAVPETAASSIKAGSEAELTSDQFSNRVFKGKVVRDSGSFDATTRTLNVEVDIDNPSGEILPGAYGFLHLHSPVNPASITIPANALIFRSQGTQVAVVRDGHADLLSITIGRDFGDKVEIISGLTANDTVIVDPSDSLLEGAPVEVEKEI